MRVVIADHHVLLADGISRLLDAYHHEVVAIVDTGPGLIAAIEAHRPDAAVVDIRLPPTFTDEGLRAAVEIRRRTKVAILVLSQYAEAAYARELLTTGGGTGYLIKDRISRPREFIEALVTVAEGGTVLDPEVVAQMFTRDHARQALASLTECESDVLKRMAEGLSNAGISAALFITEATVEKHINSVYAKLGLPPSSEDHRRVRAVLTYLNL